MEAGPHIPLVASTCCLFIPSPSILHQIIGQCCDGVLAVCPYSLVLHPQSSTRLSGSAAMRCAPSTSRSLRTSAAPHSPPSSPPAPTSRSSTWATARRRPRTWSLPPCSAAAATWDLCTWSLRAVLTSGRMRCQQRPWWSWLEAPQSCRCENVWTCKSVGLGL